MRCNWYALLLVVALVISITTSQQVNGEEIPVGKIDKIEGEVTILRTDGKEIAGEVGLSLFPGDQITTGERGMVWFSLQQGGQFRLGEEAQASIDELSASEEEDDQPTLRLVLGYLWSKIRKLKGKPPSLVLHTPTVIVGVRSTEFDTVVSLDGTSVITVDEGSVEVEAEDEKIILEKGRMAEVEAEVKPAAPIQAIPKEKRDWQAWRKKRIKKLLENLPQKAPKFRKRFEMAVTLSMKFTSRIKEASDRINEAIEKIRQAKRDKDRKKAVQLMRRLRERVQSFKVMVDKFRRTFNRLRVMGRLSHRVEKFVAKNKEHFSDQDLAVIESNLAIISQKRKQLKEIFQQTVFKIRQTFRELRELKKEIKRKRSVQSQ